VWEDRITAFHKNGFATEAPATIARWFTPEFVRSAPLTMAWVERMIRTTDPQGYVDAIRAIQALDHAARLVDIRCPTLVIAGERDQALSPAAGRSIATVIPAARFAMLEGAAHLGNVEQACAFTELAGAFLCDALGSDPYPQ
jgi:3-oxoadipate enol-lactonase